MGEKMGIGERWHNSNLLTKTILIIAPAMAAFLGAIASAPAAYEALDNMGVNLPAFRAYVRGEVSPLKSALALSEQRTKDVQYDVAMGKRENYDNEKAKWQLELSKATDDGTRALIVQQIQKLDRNNDALTDQMRALRGVRGPN